MRDQEARRVPVRHPIVAGALTPLVYVTYVAIVRTAAGEAVRWAPAAPGMIVFLLLLGTLGGGSALLWQWGLRVPAPLVGGWLLLQPALAGTLPHSRHLWLVSGLVGVAALVETIVRTPARFNEVFAGRFGRIALLAGAGHFGVAFAMQILARRLFWTELAPFATMLWAVIYLTAGLASAALGVIPVLCWARRRLVTPALVVGGWFAWGIAGTLRTLSSYPVSSFTGVAHVAVTPTPDYMVRWIVPLATAIALGGLEVAVRSSWQAWDRRRSGDV